MDASALKALYFDAYGTRPDGWGFQDPYNKKITYDGFSAASSGCGMDIGTGIFTAPVSGAYFFNFNAMKNKVPNRPIDLKLSVENEVYAAIASGASSTDNLYSVVPEPMTAIAHMQKGQRAWVQFGQGGSISSWEDRVTHFSGVLISAL